MVRSPMSNVPIASYPDGSQMPSVTFRHKQVYTLRPSADGRLSFAILPGVDGSLLTNRGNGFAASVPQVTTLSADYNSFFPYTQIPGLVQSNDYCILPYNEFPTATNLASKAGVPFFSSQFRVLAQEAVVSYTGTSFEDSGFVSMDKRSIRPELDARGSPLNAQGLQGSFDIVLANVFPAVAGNFANGSTVTMPARESWKSLTVATKPVFSDVHQNRGISSVGGTYRAGVAQYNSSSGMLEQNWYHGVDSNVPLTSVLYTGLASSASITVEVATIIEYAIMTGSPLAGMATPNPPEHVQTVDYVSKAFSYMPTAERIGAFVGSLYAAYRGGGAGPSSGPSIQYG